MLNAIVHFSLRFRGIVIALACALLGYGLYSLSQARYDVFPEFAPPRVVVQTEAPGLAPEQVEVLVTQPIENVINGVPRVDSVRSGSIQGLSVITVVFQPQSDVYRDRQVLAERLTSATGNLPTGVHAPVMTPLTTSTSLVLTAAMTSQKQTPMHLRTIADWTVRRRLLAVRGVAGVSVFGGDIKQFQIQLNPERLVQHNIGLEEVIAASKRATGVRGAGFIDTPNQRIVAQTEGQSPNTGQIAHTVVLHQQGANLTLGDVATVAEAPEPAIGEAEVMGQPGILLMVDAQYGSNTLDVTHNLEQAIGELRPTLAAEGIAIRADIFRPANFIETALHNIRSSLLVGAILIMIVLFLFLFNLRTAAISCTAIPLSLLAAIVVMERFGFSLNTMTLGGLAIATGEVVDDAVIDVENIFRRLRENRHSPNPRPALRVVFDASIEVRKAVIFATFAVILVFIPVLTMSGLAGRLFAPLGVAYISAITASLVVALTVTPALSLVLLADGHLPHHDAAFTRWLKERYASVLMRVEEHRRVVIATVICLVAVGIAVLPFLGATFLPELREGHFIIHTSAAPGTSLRESMRLGHQVTQELLKIPYVRSVAQQIGRAEAFEDTWGTHYSEIHVDLKPIRGSLSKGAQAEIRQVMQGFPALRSSVETFLTERIQETLSGYNAAVVVNVYGNDLDTLDSEARQVAQVLASVRGATEVQVQSPPGMPQVAIRLRKDGINRWGFDPLDVLDAVQTAYGGETVGQVYDGNRVFDVSVVLAPDERRNPEQIGDLPLRSSEGNYVPLRQLADIYETSGRYIVLHQGARRAQTITCNVTGRDVSSFVAEAKQRVGALSLSSGDYVDFAGTAAAQAQSRRDLLVHSVLAGLGIILLLSIVMGGYRNLLLVLANLPFALVGGVLAGFASGGVLSIGSLVGFVTLFGITLRNSIMMISHYEHIVSNEGVLWGKDASIRGATERLIPILMTATVTGLGLLPLAIGAGDPGREIEGPMAIVILGGLVTSTVLNLLVLPTLSLRYGRFQPSEPDHV